MYNEGTSETLAPAGYDGDYCTTDFSGQEETDRYWYHPDHLGSSSFVTGLDGEVNQNIEYFPSGETFVENHLNSYNVPYKFNAKELDDETGYYYYGARYYNPRVSLWLNVDPAFEEYPSWSPYVYTFNHPINFIDPDGNRIKPSSNWKAAGSLKFNLLYFNAMYNKNHSDKKDTSAFSCSMCCINALEDNLSLLYSNRLKRLDNYDKMMQQVRQLGYRGDREIAQPTLKGKTLNSSNSVAEFSDKNFNTGIVDNLLDQLKGNKGVYVFGVGIANGYHSTIVTAVNDGTKVTDNQNNITYTSSDKNPIFVFVEDNGGARVFTAKQLEAKFKEYYITAASFYAGKRSIGGKTVNNTDAKDMGARIDNLEYKKSK